MSEIEVKNNTTSKLYNRYISIDLLRGFAIFIMIILHVISDTLNIDYYIGDINNIGYVNIFALLTFPFLGGLAGLFLMTSAMGNIVAMRKNLEKGYSPNSVIQKQVIGGFLVLIFAMVGEATIGYHGYFGQIFKNLNDLSNIDSTVARHRAFEIETLHTIAWAIIINGIVQGVISKYYDIKSQVKEIIRVYWILSIIVLILTPILWFLTTLLIPGYPFDINPVTNMPYYRPVIGISSFGEILLYTFLNPIGAPIEPIFPYLTTSFVGSIMGLHLSNDKNQFDRSFLRTHFKIGLYSFIIGFIGVIFVLISILNERGIDAMLNQYQRLPYHRSWVSSQGAPGGWIWQYLALNGVSLMFVCFGIRIGEYRGNSKSLAKNTQFIRRFGFIALTVYLTQWIYFIAHFILTSLPNFTPYQRVYWPVSWLILILALSMFHLIMTRWEKVGYIGSLEWMISGIANRLAKVKKQSSVSSTQNAVKWYNIGKLKVPEIFYDPNWVNFEMVNKSKDELRLIKYFLIIGFLLPIFGILNYILIRNYEIEFDKILRQKLICIFGIIFSFMFYFIGFFVTLQDIGITL